MRNRSVGKIESASVSWVTGALKVLGFDGGIMLKVSITGLKKDRRARKCATEIMRLKELYAAREVGASPPAD